jgi:hypothetical protein
MTRRPNGLALLMALMLLAAGCAGPVTPTGPPELLPPINLKFLGFVEQAAGKPKIAILSDGSGSPQYAKEGDVVSGRYRVLKIGEESVEVAYSDGRVRQTIRMTGS